MPATEDLATDLATALRDAEIEAAYQPQISLRTGDVEAVEALCRWRHPTMGEVDPATMIDLAEKTGVIHDLGRFMLDDCLDLLESWRANGREWELAVNVSPLQLVDEAFARCVFDEFRRRELAPASLTLEITENLPLLDAPAVLPRLRVLREIGVGISLDEFGAGYASLERLENLPLTEVKIAGPLVRSTDPDRLGALRESIEVAHERGLRVVAEGIETQQHLETAAELGCDRAQGFLISRPHPRAAVE